jgi:hypothetical protein
MIKDFWVENYLSIRNRQMLDFTAKGPETELVAEVSKGVYLYKLAVLFGANASGKSNILQALDGVFRLLTTPQSDTMQRIRQARPFILTRTEPTAMHLTFYADAVRYDYEVSFNDSSILSESLYYFPNASRALFYERTFVSPDTRADIRFGAGLRLSSRTQESIRQNTLNNHTVLAVCGKISFKEDIAPLVNLYQWIRTHYCELDRRDMGIAEQLTEAFADNRKRRFYELMLGKADLNIERFRPVVSTGEAPLALGESILFANASARGSFEVPLELQSNGTLQFIEILRPLYMLITSNVVCLLDELGENLHQDLLVYFINVFLSNSNRSQLIITSQETSLLAHDLFNENRGMAWFVEKERDTASSTYNRGDSFGLHHNLSLYNSYHVGRLGAKPEFGSFFIDLD